MEKLRKGKGVCGRGKKFKNGKCVESGRLRFS